MFVFRIFAFQNSGLGHIVRMQVLANELEAQGYAVCFIIDQLSPELEPFLSERSVFSLELGLTLAENSIKNQAKNTSQNLCEAQDALAVIDLIKKENITPSWVIVDHYGLGKVWEQRIQMAGFKVFAMDDLLREHSAELLLDARWRGEKMDTSYSRLVSESTHLLLGPQFLLLKQPENFFVGPKKNNEFRLLVGLGGGGDWVFLEAMLASIIDCFGHTKTLLHLKVILGPMLSSMDIFETSELLKSRLPDNIQIDWLHGKTDLSFEHQWCDFYLGAAGGTIYQIRALKKPALFFSTSKNQDSGQTNLDDIGQYFFLDLLETTQFKDLAILIKNIAAQLLRINRLFQQAKISIDYKGAKKVSAYLINEQLSNRVNQTCVLKNKFSYKFSWESLSVDYAIRPVEDVDINHYLKSRNHPANRKKMLDTQEISKLKHYCWWLNTKRRSFLLAKNNQPKLYIWDQLKSFDSEQYLIGGWFVCDEQTSHQEAMIALDWQLKTCQEVYPNVTWVAVINRNNRYVKLMNDYFGFKEIDSSSRYKEVIEAFFPAATIEEFFYVYK